MDFNNILNRKIGSRYSPCVKPLLEIKLENYINSNEYFFISKEFFAKHI